MLTLTSVVYGQTFGVDCDTIEGYKVPDVDGLFNDFPEDYTGVAVVCKNGKAVMIVNYQNGKEHGLQRTFWENGQLAQEVNYVNGKREGVEKGWHDNGQLHYESTFKDGLVIDGWTTHYNKDGSFDCKILHKNGAEIGCEGNCLPG